MADNTSADVIVLGGGPGGTAAALRAAQAGLRVLLFEPGALGGICLNAGCIPSKTLLHAARLYHHARHSADVGLRGVDALSFDMAAAHARVQTTIGTLRRGLAGALDRAGVTVVPDAATLHPDRTVRAGGRTYQARFIVLAAGARPAQLDVPGADQPHVLGTSGALNLQKLPATMVVVGGGAISLGLATLYGLLGAQVIVLSPGNTVLPGFDVDSVPLVLAGLTNIHVHTQASVSSIHAGDVRVMMDGAPQDVPAEVVVVSLGRTPDLDALGLRATDLDANDDGVRVSVAMQTNLPGVYAIGDLLGTRMWAHAAAREGEVAVEHMLGHASPLRSHTMPLMAYTAPEAISVGLTEAEAHAQGRPVRVLKLPMQANGRFLIEHGAQRGMIKLVADANTRVLLGVHMVGDGCVEQAFGAAALIDDEFRVDELAHLWFPHPTTSEALADAARLWR